MNNTNNSTNTNDVGMFSKIKKNSPPLNGRRSILIIYIIDNKVKVDWLRLLECLEVVNNTYC